MRLGSRIMEVILQKYCFILSINICYIFIFFFFYVLQVPQGLGEEEMQKSIETLKKMAESLNADLTVLRERDGVEGKVAEVLIRRLVLYLFTLLLLI